MSNYKGGEKGVGKGPWPKGTKSHRYGKRWRWNFHKCDCLKCVKHREAARRYYHKKRKEKDEERLQMILMGKGDTK